MKAREKAIFRIGEISSFVYSRFVEVEESEPITDSVSNFGFNGFLFLSILIVISYLFIDLY
jgi:hypothetical protein